MRAFVVGLKEVGVTDREICEVRKEYALQHGVRLLLQRDLLDDADALLSRAEKEGVSDEVLRRHRERVLFARAEAEREARLSSLTGGKEAADAFVCPLTGCRMFDPVVASDGHTYERSAIEEHLLRDPTRRSPLTREPLSPTLVPNRALASAAEQHTDSLLRVVAAVSSTKAC